MQRKRLPRIIGISAGTAPLTLRVRWKAGAVCTLWRLAQEQSGATMTAEAFRRWREAHAYSLDAAAAALGLSRRTIAYYEQGEKPIPRVVALATRGLELTA